jgi:hypothetical protein
VAFSQVIKGTLDLGGAKLIHGTWNNASVTTGTIDIRGTLGGTATKIPFELIGGNICNTVAAVAPDMLFSANGTVAFTSGSSDTGTFYLLLK